MNEQTAREYRRIRVGRFVHLHAARGACRTECGIDCDAVETAYRGLDRGRVTCPACLTAGSDAGSAAVHVLVFLALFFLSACAAYVMGAVLGIARVTS